MNRSPSTDCYVVAAFLAFFALPRVTAGHPLGAIELALAAAAVAAGIFMRTRRPESRFVGVVVLGLVVVVGVLAMLTGAGYVTGSLVALLAVVRLARSGDQFGAPQPPLPTYSYGYLQPGDVRSGQPMAGQPMAGQPQYGDQYGDQQAPNQASDQFPPQAQTRLPTRALTQDPMQPQAQFPIQQFPAQDLPAAQLPGQAPAPAPGPSWDRPPA